MSQSSDKKNINVGFSIDEPVPEAQEVGVMRTSPRKRSQSSTRNPSANNSSTLQGRKPNKKVSSPQISKISLFRKIFNIIIVIINVIVGLGLIFTAYAQRISPTEWPYAVVVTMTFPWWLFATVVIFAFDLRWWRRTAWVAGLSMLACLGQIHDYSPLNLPHLGMSQSKKDNAFTLMTYNVFGLNDFQEEKVGYNKQLAYIMKQNPDIVCMQEAHYISPTEQNEITQSQLDSLHTLYPYVMTQGNDFAILSKYPVKPINIDFPKKEFKSGEIAAWRLDVKGKVLNLFSVHLRSFALTDKDKGAYQDIVKLDSISRTDLREAKTEIIPKITQAGIERAEQIRLLQRYLARYGGKNAIVCGDFNDPVGCYGLYLLSHESKMKQVYTEVGFGPMITYNANDLYFRIDHVLYRGDLQPWSIKRGRLKASDHYPLLTTFVLK